MTCGRRLVQLSEQALSQAGTKRDEIEHFEFGRAAKGRVYYFYWELTLEGKSFGERVSLSFGIQKRSGAITQGRDGADIGFSMQKLTIDMPPLFTAAGQFS